MEHGSRDYTWDWAELATGSARVDRAPARETRPRHTHLAQLRDDVAQALADVLSDNAALGQWAVPALLDPFIDSRPWPGLPPPEQSLVAALVLDPSLRGRALRGRDAPLIKGLWLVPTACRGARLSMAALVDKAVLASADVWVARERARQTLAQQGVRLHLRFLTAEDESWPGSVQFAVPLCGEYPGAWLPAEAPGSGEHGDRAEQVIAPGLRPGVVERIAPALSLAHVLRRALLGMVRQRGTWLDLSTRRKLLNEAGAPELWCRAEAIALSGLWGLLNQDKVLAESAGLVLALIHDDATWRLLQRLLGLPPCHHLPTDPQAAAEAVRAVLFELLLLLEMEPEGTLLAQDLRGWLAQFESREGWIARSLVRELRLGEVPGKLVLERAEGGRHVLRQSSLDGPVLAEGSSIELTLGRMASHGLLKGDESLRVLQPLKPTSAGRILNAVGRWFRSRQRALVLVETEESADTWSLAAPAYRVALLVRQGQGVRVEVFERQRDFSWLAQVPRAAAGSVQLVPVAGARAWILCRVATEALVGLARGQDLVIDAGVEALVMTQRSWRPRPVARTLNSLLGRHNGALRVTAVGSGPLASALRCSLAQGARASRSTAMHVFEDAACVVCVDASAAVHLWSCQPRNLVEVVEDLSQFCRECNQTVRVLWHATETRASVPRPTPPAVRVSLSYRSRRPWQARVDDLTVDLGRQPIDQLAQAILACTRPFHPPLFRIAQIDLPQAGLVRLIRLRGAIERRLVARLSRLAERTQISPQGPARASR